MVSNDRLTEQVALSIMRPLQRIRDMLSSTVSTLSTVSILRMDRIMERHPLTEAAIIIIDLRYHTKHRMARRVLTVRLRMTALPTLILAERLRDRRITTATKGRTMDTLRCRQMDSNHRRTTLRTNSRRQTTRRMRMARRPTARRIN